MFYLHFLISSLISSTSVLIILTGKKLVGNQISARWQFRIWYLMLAASTFPLIPLPLWNSSFLAWTGAGFDPSTQTSTAMITHAGSSTSLLRDFAVSVNRPDFYTFNIIAGIIWISGMFVLASAAVIASHRLKQISKSAEPVHDSDTNALFQQCERKLHVKRHLVLMESSCVKSPITYGFFKTYTILPVNINEKLTTKQLEHIFLHEISHIKHGDNQVNALIFLLRLIYWFNPLIWIGIKEMKLDREIACDMSVLNLLDQRDRSEYGYTILCFADRSLHHLPLALENGMGGSGRQIKRRLEKILSFSRESGRIKVKSVVASLIIAILVVCQLPILSVFAAGSDRYNFKGDNVSYEDLSTYFNGYSGCIVLYDSNTNHYDIYNKDKSSLRVSPDSTYKIYSALIGLQKGIISPSTSTIKWNHKVYPFDTWNADQDLKSAMRNSVNWYFQSLDRQVGLNGLEKYFEQFSYGNCDLSGGINAYWMDSSLLISPIEQVQALKKFYYNTLGFSPVNVDAVKNSLRISENSGETLFGKTGTGIVNNKDTSGWFIGYVEEKGDVIFFATNIQNSNSATGEKAAHITLSILTKKKIY